MAKFSTTFPYGRPPAERLSFLYASSNIFLVLLVFTEAFITFEHAVPMLSKYNRFRKMYYFKDDQGKKVSRVGVKYDVTLKDMLL